MAEVNRKQWRSKGLREGWRRLERAQRCERLWTLGGWRAAASEEGVVHLLHRFSGPEHRDRTGVSLLRHLTRDVLSHRGGGEFRDPPTTDFGQNPGSPKRPTPAGGGGGGAVGDSHTLCPI